jgi:hypothetical protein
MRRINDLQLRSWALALAQYAASMQEIRSAVAQLPDYGNRRAWALMRHDRAERGAAAVNSSASVRNHRLLQPQSAAPTAAEAAP